MKRFPATAGEWANAIGLSVVMGAFGLAFGKFAVWALVALGGISRG